VPKAGSTEDCWEGRLKEGGLVSGGSTFITGLEGEVDRDLLEEDADGRRSD
jgi:hypothetical protein